MQPNPLTETSVAVAGNNITSTEEVKIRRQPSKETSRKRRLKQLENGEMRGRKIPKVSNGSTDDNGQYNGSSSFQGPTLNETPVPKIVSYNGQRGMCTVLILYCTHY